MRFDWAIGLAAALWAAVPAHGAVLISGDAGSFAYFDIPHDGYYGAYSFNYDPADVDPTPNFPMVFDLYINGQYQYLYYDAARGDVWGNEDILTLYCSLRESASLCELPGNDIVPRVALTVEKVREGQINFSLSIGAPYTAPCVEDYVICSFAAGGTLYLDVGFNQDTPVPITVTSPPLPVPEPAAWGMMIGGLGVAGGALRLRRRCRASPPSGNIIG